MLSRHHHRKAIIPRHILLKAPLLGAVCFFGLLGCSTQRKLASIRSGSLAPSLSLPPEERIAGTVDTSAVPRRDTIRVLDFDGHEVFLMNAVRDEDGEMVATEMLDAVVVTATFRNVAERHGRVDLRFQVRVPRAMQDSKWQLRLLPEMRILEDTVALESIVITGEGYRKAQLRGYQQYERFLGSIVTDSTLLTNRWQMELFLERNLPRVYALKADTTFVSDEAVSSLYGVTERAAFEHYTNKLLKMGNDRRKARRSLMYSRFVKAPLLAEGLRLDTLIRAADGDFIYNYTQTVATRPRLRKVDILMRGGIWEQDNCLYDMPPGDTLTFYISSLSSFVDGTERYMTEVIERRAEANTACYIDFAQGSSDIDQALGNNPDEIGRIKGNLKDLLENEKFDLDSITISAFASPEGSVTANRELSLRRARSASRHFSDYVLALQDSISRERGFSVDEFGNIVKEQATEPIRFLSRGRGENWTMLDSLVRNDTGMDEGQKEEYFALADIGDPDRREREMQKTGAYQYLRSVLYPQLRVVKFDFFLHRRGMVKDTVHTTVLDTTYMKGVQAMRERDFETAVTLLRPYRDYNAAVAFCAMDYNESAMDILQGLEKTAQVNYMMAIVHSRRGDEQNAVQHYLWACREDPSLVHRGNLDPEISTLIRKYDLNAEPEDDWGDLAY